MKKRNLTKLSIKIAGVLSGHLPEWIPDAFLLPMFQAMLEYQVGGEKKDLLLLHEGLKLLREVLKKNDCDDMHYYVELEEILKEMATLEEIAS